MPFTWRGPVSVRSHVCVCVCVNYIRRETIQYIMTHYNITTYWKPGRKENMRLSKRRLDHKYLMNWRKLLPRAAWM